MSERITTRFPEGIKGIKKSLDKKASKANKTTNKFIAELLIKIAKEK